MAYLFKGEPQNLISHGSHHCVHYILWTTIICPNLPIKCCPLTRRLSSYIVGAQTKRILSYPVAYDHPSSHGPPLLFTAIFPNLPFLWLRAAGSFGRYGYR